MIVLTEINTRDLYSGKNGTAVGGHSICDGICQTTLILSPGTVNESPVCTVRLLSPLYVSGGAPCSPCR